MGAKRAEVVLTSYNMGDATPQEFDAWAGFVSDNLESRVGFPVVVGLLFGRAMHEDAIRGGSEWDEIAIRDALGDLWDEWCALGAPSTKK